MLVYEFTNPHPKGIKTSDCVVRAVALAFDKDYLEARRELNKAKRESKFDSYKDTKFIYDYLKEYERLIIAVERGKPRMKADEFVWKYGKGTYIVKWQNT